MPFPFNQCFFLLGFGLLLISCSGGRTSGDEAQTDSMAKPKAVVEALANAAKTEKFEGLGQLCDPQKENDQDTQRVCNLATEAKDRESFVKFFGKMSIQGEAQISDDGNKAAVSVLVGPKGDEAETMNLIKRDGKWYLSSF